VFDTWNAVAGDDLAHLFPAAGGACLCGRHPAADKGKAASCIAAEPFRGGRPYRPHCGECRRLREAQWDLVPAPAAPGR